jgi:putative transcriptional regulator
VWHWLYQCSAQWRAGLTSLAAPDEGTEPSLLFDRHPMTSLQGHFLVASPHLSDGNFFRSVVLMIKHDNEGAFGVILNRPTQSSVEDVWNLLSEEPVSCKNPVYVGGPVTGPVTVLHGMKTQAEAEVIPGVYFSAHQDHLKRIISQNRKPFRMFSGYGGWGAGQLEGELEAGGWLTAPASEETVFYKEDNLWEVVCNLIGLDILAAGIKTKHVPADPNLN